MSNILKIVKIKESVNNEDIEFHPYGRKLDRTKEYSVLKEDRDDYSLVISDISAEYPPYFPKEWFDVIVNI